jgi:hypothetical protein
MERLQAVGVSWGGLNLTHRQLGVLIEGGREAMERG